MNKHICTCHCHIEGRGVMHFSACCKHTYEKYIRMVDFNGVSRMTLDRDLYEKITGEKFGGAE